MFLSSLFVIVVLQSRAIIGTAARHFTDEAHNGAASTAATIPVRFYGEAQCPYCRKFVVEAWPSVWHDDELRRVIDYDFVPWGNAYFATQECGAGPYDHNERSCWYEKCRTHHDKTRRMDDDACFSGAAIYQHADKEGKVDIYESCVKKVYGVPAAVDFTLCCEGSKMDDTTIGTAQELMETCLSNAEDTNASAVIQDCYDTEGKGLEIENAQLTPDHTGVPYVVVNGHPLENPFEVKQAICEALQKRKARNQHHAHEEERLPSACDDPNNSAGAGRKEDVVASYSSLRARQTSQ